MTAAALLDKLQGVKRTGDRRWLAKCPAHDDRRPSLSVRESDDGRTLLHCWSGCEVADVLGAIGATWADLFPPRGRDFTGGAPRRQERAVSASDALRLLAHEARVVVLLAGDLARGGRISEVDRARLIVAAGRLGKAESLCSQ